MSCKGCAGAVLEAMACEVPVCAAPTGIHATALAGIDGDSCLPYDEERWSDLLSASIDQPESRPQSRSRAEEFSAVRMAKRLLAEWRRRLDSPLDSAAAPNEGKQRQSPWD